MRKGGKKPKAEGKRSPKSLACTVILAAVIVLAFVLFLNVLSNREERGGTLYSSFSGEENGSLALYYAMQEAGKRAGFSVSRFEKPARFLDGRNIVVCLGMNGFFSDSFEAGNIRKQVENGSVFILDSERGDLMETVFSGTARFEAPLPGRDELTYPWTFYRYGEQDPQGFFCFRAEEKPLLTNTALLSDPEFGAELMMLVTAAAEETGITHVVFDEYYLGVQQDYTADILSYGVVLCLAELGLAAVLLMLSRAKRFGAPRREYSTGKRDENENIYAVASLYKRTRSYDVVFDLYMERLLTDVSRVLGVTGEARFRYGEILDMLRDSPVVKQYPALKTLAETYGRTKKKIRNKKDLKKKITRIEELRRTLGDG